MAYTLLDGTNALIDLKVGIVPGISSTATNSIKCIAGQMSFTFRKTTQKKVTFCNTGWADVTGGDKQMFAVVGGFMSKGDVISDPLVLFTATGILPFVFTADTGCTLTGNWIETEDANTLAAQANSGRSMAFESSGPVASTWVVA